MLVSSYELFYQVGLSDFGNFGTIKLDPPLALKDLIQIAAEEEKQAQEQADVVMAGTEETEFDWDEAVEASQF